MTLDLKHDDAPADPAPTDRGGRRGGGVGAARRPHRAGHRLRAPSPPSSPGLVWCTISGFGGGQPLRQAAGARHHVPRLLGPHGADGGRHRAAHARLRARGAVRLAHRGGRHPRRPHRSRPHRRRGASSTPAIVDSATWVLGEAVAARRGRPPAGWGKRRPGAPTAPPTGSWSRWPPPNRARGRRSARRSTARPRRRG